MYCPSDKEELPLKLYLVVKPEGTADFLDDEVLVPKSWLYTGARALLAQIPCANAETAGNVQISSVNRYVYLFVFMDIGGQHEIAVDSYFIDIGYLKLMLKLALKTSGTKLGVNNRIKR